ncbi:ATP-binding cassette domain-containing protein [Micromonospora sp. NPDC018662]|uniref:ATP-binding cassette domain-containing protein n=1 Tax=Micromonospora sp. NPDC018662 TaxID=3364238 RepID=UPI0037A65BAA
MSTSPVIEVDRLLDLVDLTDRADRKVAQLSGGEKRRLDFATAAHGTPELLFLDEPTTGPDTSSRDALWATVDRLRENGATRP